MKILVTGGAGFIGSHIVDSLILSGHEVIVVDNLSTGNKENVNPLAKFCFADLGNFPKMEEIFRKEKPEVVYHLAAQIDVRKSVENPVEDARTNIINALNLLELCIKNKVKHFIFSSTGGAIYGDSELPTKEGTLEMPISPYGCAKLTIEKYLYFYKVVHGLHYTVLRYANVYGPRQNSKGEAGVISIFIERMLSGKDVVIYGGGQTRDFVFVEDVAKANILALNDKKDDFYNVSTAIEINMNQLFGKINGLFNGEFKAEFQEYRKGEQLTSCLSNDKIAKELRWKPEVGIDMGLRKTFDWYKSRHK